MSEHPIAILLMNILSCIYCNNSVSTSAADAATILLTTMSIRILRLSAI